MIIHILREGMRTFWWFSDKYETPMFNNVITTCRLHVHDVFEGIFVMVKMGQVKYW